MGEVINIPNHKYCSYLGSIILLVKKFVTWPIFALIGKDRNIQKIHEDYKRQMFNKEKQEASLYRKRGCWSFLYISCIN